MQTPVDKVLQERMARLVLSLADTLNKNQSLHLQLLSSMQPIVTQAVALAEFIKNVYPELHKEATKGNHGYVQGNFEPLIQNGHGWAEPPEEEM